MTFVKKLKGTGKSELRKKGMLISSALSLLRTQGYSQVARKVFWIARRGGLSGLANAWEIFHVRSRSAGTGGESHYEQWIAQYETLDDVARSRIRRHIKTLRRRPLISIVMPVYNPKPEFLDLAIESVRNQIYPHWELCIADDASTDPHIRELLEKRAKEDSRLKVVFRERNGHISAATNSALEIATGEFVALLDHDDLLAEQALYRVAIEVTGNNDLDIVYSDSDVINEHGVRYDPFFKPDFNIELVLGENMVSHLGVFRRTLIEKIGGMRLGYEGSQDYDLLLRAFAASSASQVRHIPQILYHWRRPSDEHSFSGRNLEKCVLAARRAVSDFLLNEGLTAQVVPAPNAPNWQRIIYPLPASKPSVTAIVPIRNRPKLLRQILRGLLDETNYDKLEIVIVDNDSDDSETKDLLAKYASGPRVRVLQYSGAFNFSAINNFAVRETNSEIIAFLNNDIEIIHDDWLNEMVSHAIRPKIGAVGAKLYYPDNRIQHAGVMLGIGGVASHMYIGMPRNFGGRAGDCFLTHEVSAVTAACMVMKRSAFDSVGGFDENNLAIAYNDVDLCMRLREKGFRNIWTPFAELYHHESASRGSDMSAENLPRFLSESEYMKQKWGLSLSLDPFHNPNLSLESTLADFAHPPRVARPWEDDRFRTNGRHRKGSLIW
jgi:glycosyltransferase involved in cell wall biosynthesis